jgi:hypothetical protein
MKESFKDNTYSLLKAMYHTKIAMEYYDDVAKDYQGSAKHLMLSYANKCRFILDNIRHRVPSEMITEIDRDLSDSLFVDAVEEKIIHFNQDQRDTLEKIIEMMHKGVPVEVRMNKSIATEESDS